ncbi:MAG TPA: carboxypeptidase regulatory-like domain-containing protein [Marmoricola sp.]|nr:carboxypeptidase regulatory-like domain-containing protein [Marmoricola sp.]
MKSAMSRSVLGRRVVPGTVLAIAAATLSLGVAGPASAANTIELQGTVTGAGGAPLAGATVSVYDVNNESSSIASTTTAADGTYSFDSLTAGQVKVEFAPDNSGASPVTATSPLPYQDRWSGGSRYFKGATATTITVDPATPASVNANLPQYASISGNIRVGADAHVPTSDFGAISLDADNDPLGSFMSLFALGFGSGEFTDAATGDYRFIVDPAGPVRIYGLASDTDKAYLSQFWVDADTFSAATPVSVSPGQNVSGINFRLTDVLRNRKAPSIVGHPTVGLPLSATPGTWARNTATEFSYAWLRDGLQVGTGATYTPTAADFGKKLTLVVTAINGDFAGQSTTAASEVVRYASTVKGGAKALKGHKVRFGIKLVSAHQKPVKGKVIVLRGTKVVHKAVKLVKGRAVIVVKHQPKGTQTFTVHFKGNKKLSQIDKAFTVRVRK